MAAHLGHYIPWDVLSSTLKNNLTSTETSRGTRYRISIDDRAQKAIRHFARRLYSTLEEFAATNKDDAATIQLHNPVDWDPYFGHSTGGGAQINYFKSTLLSYIQLNLLLIDYETFSRIKPPDDEWMFKCCRGRADYDHPDWIADQFELLFKDGKFRVIDKAMTEQIAHISKLYFKCLYSHITATSRDGGGGNRISVRMISDDIRWMYSVDDSKVTDVALFSWDPHEK